MWKFVVLVLAVYVLYRMFINDKRRKDSVKTDMGEARVKAGDLAKDPICGTYVSKENALTVRENDNIYYFCSYECRDAFLKQKNALDVTDESSSMDANIPNETSRGASPENKEKSETSGNPENK